jgi:predicted metalloendopeptidase
VNKTAIPEGQFSVGPWTFMKDRINMRLKVILEEPPGGNEIAPFQNAKKFYKSCLNFEKMRNLERKPVLKKLNAMGGWPVLMSEESWNESEWTWEKSVTKSLTNGFNGDFLISIIITNEDVVVKIICLSILFSLH